LRLDAHFNPTGATMIDPKTLNPNALAALARSWFEQQNLTPPAQSVLLSIAQFAKQALIEHASPRGVTHAAAVPYAVDQACKYYVQSRKGLAKQSATLAVVEGNPAVERKVRALTKAPSRRAARRPRPK
jgi:hypothetical protein